MKVKEHLQKTKEKKLEIDCSYEEWLNYSSKELTNKELEEMSRNFKQVSNNPDYYPLQGA